MLRESQGGVNLYDLGKFSSPSTTDDDLAQALQTFLLNHGVPLDDPSRAYSDYPKYKVLDIRHDEAGIGPGCWHRDLSWWSERGWDEEQWLVLWSSDCPTLIRAYDDELPENNYPPRPGAPGEEVMLKPRSVVLVDERHYIHAMPEVTVDRIFVRAHVSGPLDLKRR